MAFRTFRVGTQEIVVLRDDTGELRAFHNTCRHRGSQLCQESEGRLKARLITCPYPCLVLLAARRSRARSLEIAARWFRQGRSSALPGGAVGVARLCLCEPSAGDGRLRRDLLRSRIRRPRQLAAGNAGIRPCPAQGDELQLEDLLGELQRVPALPRRPQGPVSAGADIRPRPDEPARRPRLGPPCRQ
ncbi:Rieske 2Fe-2S domain-containing protein [Mesorhizobium sp. M1143]